MCEAILFRQKKKNMISKKVWKNCPDLSSLNVKTWFNSVKKIIKTPISHIDLAFIRRHNYPKMSGCGFLELKLKGLIQDNVVICLFIIKMCRGVRHFNLCNHHIQGFMFLTLTNYEKYDVFLWGFVTSDHTKKVMMMLLIHVYVLSVRRCYA